MIRSSEMKTFAGIARARDSFVHPRGGRKAMNADDVSARNGGRRRTAISRRCQGFYRWRDRSCSMRAVSRALPLTELLSMNFSLRHGNKSSVYASRAVPRGVGGWGELRRSIRVWRINWPFPLSFTLPPPAAAIPPSCRLAYARHGCNAAPLFALWCAADGSSFSSFMYFCETYCWGRERERERRREGRGGTAERAFSLSEHSVWREEIKSVMKSQRRYLVFELN